MSFVAVTALSIAAAAIGAGGYAVWTARRDSSAPARPLTSADRQMLRRQFPLYARLTPDGRARLDALIERFQREIRFAGRDGYAVSEEFRLLIAAQACLLVAGPGDRWFPTLKQVIVYPAEFTRKEMAAGHLFAPLTDVIATGESWMRGPVILAANHAAYGALMDNDGHNLVIHEFAHQLDQADGRNDGVPVLAPDNCVKTWDRVFAAAFERLCADVEAERKSVFDPYGAVSRVEFFAIAVEAFFETPAPLRLAEPDVYSELTRYFGFDPMGE